jgi:pimeloyl-ACP methyl ester carboxylesterase
MNAKPVYKSLSGKNEIMALYEAVLAHWPVAHETQSLPTRHGDTFVISSGEKSAPPVILLHGSASNAASWVGDVAEFSAHFRVMALDLPGEPGKSSENRPSWQGLEFAEWLEDVLDGLKIDRTALVGISQGGWTALRFATVQPGRVNKLVLLAPAGVAPARASFLWKAVLYSMLGRKGGEKMNTLVMGKQAMHPDAIRFMNTIMANFNGRLEKEYIFSDEELKRLTMPTLLIGGTEDALVPVEKVAPRMQSLLPQLTAELIPGMSHALVNQSGKIIPFLLGE